MAGWLAGWLAGWPAGRLVGWPAGRLVMSEQQSAKLSKEGVPSVKSPFKCSGVGHHLLNVLGGGGFFVNFILKDMGIPSVEFSCLQSVNQKNFPTTLYRFAIRLVNS
jgi:hypothetical protein